MSNDKLNSGRVRRLMQAIGKRTIEYLKEELEIPVNKAYQAGEDVVRMQLRELTSILALDAEIRLLVAFSFDHDLAEKILTASAEGLQIADDERDEMREEAVAEMINIVAGNAIAGHETKGKTISITPPVVINEAKTITRHKGATFRTIQIVTGAGLMSIHFVGPKDFFTMNLDYAEGIND
ncbi:chemotaxis protein CheX [Desulfurivibrio alkaliphilus]|uniref:CheC domain protein n=1 Tax=Desulfurivibrio alkaliphilus (strain DSM 19089 / UNIQEM U267 / AHT2) TaxID=589865 RepID=D6Z1C1_DESAT|nr:chemotaxis protein CheX [Desulfurivibrio alkaliphilus]ADH85376.1 CheC domain protein [Desulfurivibrio alkaliphilus AHT 2]